MVGQPVRRQRVGNDSSQSSKSLALHSTPQQAPEVHQGSRTRSTHSFSVSLGPPVRKPCALSLVMRFWPRSAPASAALPVIAFASGIVAGWFMFGACTRRLLLSFLSISQILSAVELMSRLVVKSTVMESCCSQPCERRLEGCAVSQLLPELSPIRAAQLHAGVVADCEPRSEDLP